LNISQFVANLNRISIEDFYHYQTVHTMKLFSLALLLIINSINIGYAQEVVIDFEGDGITDKAFLKSTEEFISIHYTLSTQKNKQFSSQKISYKGDQAFISTSKNVLKIDVQFMRGESHYKFRFDKISGQVILIGYDNVQYGNATNDGSGSSSFNLINGNYEATWHHFDIKKEKLIELPKISKKLPTKKYPLLGFSDKIIDELMDIDYQLTPSILK